MPELLEQPVRKKRTPTQKKLRRVWRFARPAVVLLVSALIVYGVARYAVNFVLSRFINPVDVSDPTPIEVVIPSSASASSIARILYTACGQDEPGLITSTAVFKVYVDFVGKANTMKAGTYILSRNMSVKQIVDIICTGNAPKATVKFTIPEGYTVTDMAQVLLEKELISDAPSFLQECADAASYASFSFISDAAAAVGESGARDYILEGYLFPDTYEVYADTTADAIVIKMLNRFNEIFDEAHKARAAELGMRIDQVVTLASLIEREAQVDEDFAKVSAVFQNRLKQDMALQSCASLSYVLRVSKFTFTESELATPSPYNTYLYKGLPAGPICNPGKTAIEAVLHPNEAYLSEGYLYFCNGNPEVSRALVFAKTYEEHQANVKTYQQYWK